MSDIAVTIGLLALLYLVYQSFQSEDSTTDSREAQDDSVSSGGSSGKSNYGSSKVTRYLRDEDLSEKSPDGKYRVVAIDSYGSLALGHSEKGVLWEKSIDRPNQPSVSNDGTVTVESWTSAESRDLGSVLYVFDVGGEELLSDQYNANARQSGITSDGGLAWFTTAHADNEDGNQLLVYDTSQQTQLLKTELPIHGVEKVRESDGVIEVTISGVDCRYRDGEMISSGDLEWVKEERRLENARSPGNVAGVLRKRLNEADELSEEKIRSTIKTARNFNGSGSDRTWAKLWRRKGELHQYLGEKKQALKDFEKALSLDEDVGVKRKSKRLRKELGDE